MTSKTLILADTNGAPQGFVEDPEGQLRSDLGSYRLLVCRFVPRYRHTFLLALLAMMAGRLARGVIQLGDVHDRIRSRIILAAGHGPAAVGEGATTRDHLERFEWGVEGGPSGQQRGRHRLRR